MSDTTAQFTGAIPEKYDRHLGPVLFEPFAADLARRLTLPEGARLLELACGTGILTRELRERFPPAVSIVASDLHDAMLDYAQARLHPQGRVEWRRVDAAAIPFDDASFNAVVSQFGVMFFPRIDAAVCEMRRVLVARGTLLFSVWDSNAHNDLFRIADATLARAFPDDPPPFFQDGAALTDAIGIHDILERNGFAEVDVRHVTMVVAGESARQVAAGLLEGTPACHELIARGRDDFGGLIDDLSAAIVRECGDRPTRARMRALVVRALRPA